MGDDKWDTFTRDSSPHLIKAKVKGNFKGISAQEQKRMKNSRNKILENGKQMDKL